MRLSAMVFSLVSMASISASAYDGPRVPKGVLAALRADARSSQLYQDLKKAGAYPSVKIVKTKLKNRSVTTITAGIYSPTTIRPGSKPVRRLRGEATYESFFAARESANLVSPWKRTRIPNP